MDILVFLGEVENYGTWKRWQIRQVLKIGDTVRRCDGSAGVGEVVGANGDLVVVFIDGGHLPTPSNVWEVVAEVISHL